MLGINIRDKIDESKVDTTDSMYPEYQKIWGLLNSIQLRGECTKRKKICEDASWTLPALPEGGCTCPDVCKMGPVSKSFNPFKKKKYECNCVVKDDEMPTQIVHDDHAEDFNVVNECFDETTGQPKSFLLRHYCKMPRTSVALFPLDPYVKFEREAREFQSYHSLISLSYLSNHLHFTKRSLEPQHSRILNEY